MRVKYKFLFTFLLGIFVLISLIFILNLFYFKITGFTISKNLEDKNQQAFIRFVIEIIKAEHLDSNRNFISDIYGEVKALDNVWSKTISSGDYVRITFEENLTSENDIIIYPRIMSGEPRIEIYEKNGDKIIAEFTDIISNENNKVLLPNLQGIQDVFDLRILEGSLEFDYIVDPDSAISYVINTPSPNPTEGTEFSLKEVKGLGLDSKPVTIYIEQQFSDNWMECIDKVDSVNTDDKEPESGVSTMKVKELKAALEEKGIEIPEGALKPDLV